jgi:hypothetical protein
MSKIIIIVDTKNPQPQKFEDVNATTFGELKSELSGKFNFDKKAVVERESRNSLEHDGAKLPNTERVVLYTSQKKIKGGMADTPSITHADVDDMSRKELMATAKELVAAGADPGETLHKYTNQSSDALRANIKALIVEESSSDAAKEEIISAINGVQETLTDVVARVEALELGSGETTPCPTLEELEMEKFASEASDFKVKA